MDGKILKLTPFTFYFCFFIFYCLYFLFFYYIKINIFHKNKNIMNFYKLFIKIHSNYYYYLCETPKKSKFSRKGKMINFG